MPSDKTRATDNATEDATALEGVRAQFALAERAAKIGYWRHDLTTDTITWSPGMFRLLDVDPEDRGADTEWLLAQVLPEDRKLIADSIAKAVKERRPFYYRSRARDPQSAIKVVETHGEVELGADGRVTCIIGVCHDITDRVAAEAAQQRAEETYRVMAEQASDIIILYDSAGRIVSASQALQRVLKRSPAEIDGSHFLDLVHPDDRSAAGKIYAEPLPGQTLTAAYRVRHGDGHYVWIEASSRAIYDEAGNLQNIIGVSRDVTERKRREFETAAARDKAEAANIAKSTFLANMSHELRTPLNAIIGFADIMRQKMFGPLGAPRYDEYVQLIHDLGELLLDLISDVLDMAKIEAGKFELHMDRVDLRAVVQDCVRLLRERAQGGGVRLEIDIPAGELTLEGDRRALKQVLLNLLSNAVKFTLAGGAVTIRGRVDSDRIALAVIDDGIGIPASELPRLGQPFEQVATDPTLSRGGTGLGLALVHALVGRHGGEVRIESEEGLGTTVTVDLPREQREDDRVAAA